MLRYIQNRINLLTMMLLPKQLRTFPDAMQQPGLWSAHLTGGADVLAACYACTQMRRQIYQKNKHQHRKPTVKKEIQQFRQEEGKEGWREGRRTTGRKKQRPSSKMLHAPSNLLTCYFQRVASPTRFTRRVASTVQFTDISRNTLQTACHYVQCIDNNFNMLQVPCHLQL